jgi:hypothetical protein
MIWVTKRRIKVNRAATAWLIRRFIDPKGEIRFVAPDEVEQVQRDHGAIGFDAPNATYPHRDDRGRCSFEALVEEHVPNDPALARMAKIVHCADFREEVDDVPEARGLRAISDGFPLIARDDDETLARASFLYDAMYAALDAEAHRIA